MNKLEIFIGRKGEYVSYKTKANDIFSASSEIDVDFDGIKVTKVEFYDEEGKLQREIGGDTWKTIVDWIQLGGIVWCETINRKQTLCTTYDDGIMEDMYKERSEEYADMDMDTYLITLCREALGVFLLESEVDFLMEEWG